MRSTNNSLSTTRGLAVLGGLIAAVLLLAVGVAFGAVPRLVDPPSTAAATAGGDGAASPAPDPSSVEAPPTPAPPTTVAPEPTPAPPTTAKAAPRRAPATTVATDAPAAAVETGPAAPAPTAPPKLAPGQRVAPTSAQVQAAIAQLHQRIPLFQPTESQLRTFADAVCSSFDQGQSSAQVQATVQQAVSNVQGASLSASDAEFAVRTVLELRCPGWLP
jgi:hypothetical protein